jgi:D-beta-D-heptose 7-phosphate kinase/D-beta-D-heptose 1-phosphate adenosyltransferase
MEHRKPRVLVLGDLLVDLWVHVRPRTGNPEGAAVVFQGRNSDRFETLGGSGLVATLLRSLGLRTKILGRCGVDFSGELIHSLLHENQLSCKTVKFVENYITPTKMRFVNEHGIVVFRYDEEAPVDVYMADYSAHFDFEHFTKLVKNADAVVIADYGKGYCQDVGPKIIEAAKYYGTLSIVGAKPQLLDAYRGADIVKINASEAATYLAVDGNQIKDGATLAEMICSRMESWAAMVTAGSAGTHYSVRNEHAAFSAGHGDAQPCAPVVKNCVGAGDAFLAGVVASLLAEPKTLPPAQAPLSFERVHDAVIAGTAVAAQFLARGFPFVDPAVPFLSAHKQRVVRSPSAKLVTTDAAMRLCDAWRSVGESVVFTNGCFDLLHRGHMHLLEQAKQQGQRLLVAVNTDNSVRALKGAGRPVQDFETRAGVLAALEYVDAVVPLDEEDFAAYPALRTMISGFAPDVLVKGAQYAESEIVGWEEVMRREPPGRVWQCPMVENCSTTQIINNVKTNDQ